MIVYVVCNVSDDREPCPVTFASKELARESLLKTFPNGQFKDGNDQCFQTVNGQEFYIYGCEVYPTIQTL